MTKNLRQKTMHGLFWSSLERFGTQGVQFVVGIILARLLAPEQFGLIAMLTIFTQVASCFIDSGFGQALIRKKEPTNTDICSIFYFNIVTSATVWLLLCISSPWIAMFYKEPILQPLVCVIGLAFVINSFGMIHRTLLTKQVNFKSQFIISLPSTIISGTAGIVAAYCGLGVWALVIQTLSAAAISSALLWTIDKWKPTLTFSITSLKEMFGFSSKLLISSIINTAFSNIYLIVIGKLYDATTLGYYSRAYRLQMFPSLNITNIVNRVAYPVFAHIHDEPERLHRAMGKAIRMLALINAPMMAWLSIVAKPLVLTLIGEKWLPCVPYLQLLCIIGFLLPFHVINLSVLQALGRSDLFLKLEIYKKAIIVLNVAITYRWGVMAMIQGQLFVSFLTFLLNAYFGGKYVKYSVFKQIKDIVPYTLATLPLVAICYYLSFRPVSAVVMLITQTLAGFSIWVLACRLARLDSFMEIWNRAVNFVTKRIKI